MRKLLLIFVLLLPLQVLATTDISITDPLKEYTWYDSFKNGLSKAFSFWKPINEKGLSFWDENIKPTVSGWGRSISEDIKEGIREEREELDGEIKELVSKATKKVWNFLKGLIIKELSTEED